MNIGVVYIENNEFEKAASVFNECLGLARDMKYFSAVVTIYANLAELYARKNDYKTAYHFQELFFAANDSMISESSTMQMQELETKYQTAQKEKEIQVKELELQKSRNRIFVLTMLVVTVLFLSIIIYVYLRREKIVAKKLEKAKSVFFSNVAHDFRTPVALITGPIEQVLAESSDWSLKQKLSMPLRNARYLLRLINQLLDVSKMETGVLTLNERLGDLSSFLFELTDQLQPMAVAKNISLTLDVPHLVVERYFDADIVEKIIYNLVSNAIKFTPENGRVAVQLSADRPDAKTVSISVRDNGIGIATKDQDLVFNRFFRSASSESNSGVGLGLSIVKDLTTLCGGTVTVSSVIGKGSEFLVTLPLRLGIQNDVVQGVAYNGDNNVMHPIVLVIEDNHDMAEFIKSVLSGSGYKVEVAASGNEGVEKATEIIPDVVVTDLMLPDIDGYEVSRTIKSHPATEHIPVIMLTARASAEKKLEGIKSGVDIYISKPFNPAELKGSIGNLLTLRTRIREQYNQPKGEKEEPITDNYVTDNYAGLRQSENVFVVKVFALIDKHLPDEQFSVDTLAKEMYLSRAQFHRKLKMLTGYAASDLIRRIRLEKAFELLKNDAGSVTEIAFMTGFNSQPYFTKCFTQQYGYSPKEVKK